MLNTGLWMPFVASCSSVLPLESKISLRWTLAGRCWSMWLGSPQLFLPACWEGRELRWLLSITVLACRYHQQAKKHFLALSCNASWKSKFCYQCKKTKFNWRFRCSLCHLSLSFSQNKAIIAFTVLEDAFWNLEQGVFFCSLETMCLE